VPFFVKLSPYYNAKAERLLPTFKKKKLSNISQESCILCDDCTLEITVAWSLLVDDEQLMMMMSYTKALMRPETFPYLTLDQDTQGGSC
jgi:NAD-dependent dihydropyrimidine dehydrogenase PreA subunit